MMRVTLRFPDLQQLYDFIEVTKTVNHGIHSGQNVLVCKLTEADLELAESGFGAEVLESHET